MEMKRSPSFQIWGALVAGFLVLSHPVVMSTGTIGDQKNYYPSPHHSGTPKSPSHGSSPSVPSSHDPPSHSGGGSCPPTTTTPTTSPPKHSGGGGYHHSPPPTIVSPPTAGGGSPPVIIDTPPSPPTDPEISSPPTDPEISSPPTPLIPDDPKLPPFIGTCDFWKTHPAAIFGIIGGWWTSLGGIIGVVGSTPTSLEPTLTIQQALANTRTDGIGALYREGTASLLNSMVSKKFPFSTEHIKQSFLKALESERTAATQAQLFKKANEGHLKLRS